VVAVVCWLPFLAAGGPTNYLHNLGVYQGELFNVLSVRAWNAWWLVQEALVGGRFLADDVAILGPLTFRHLGYAIAALGSLAIGLAIVRRPTPQTLILGLAASTLVLFTFLTGMHERYGFAALAFLALGAADRRMRWAGLAFGAVLTLNLLAAVPPTAQIGELLPIAGLLGVAGSIAMLVLAVLLVSWLFQASQDHRAIEHAGGGGPSFRP
jgi:hypothetical protein